MGCFSYFPIVFVIGLCFSSHLVVSANNVPTIFAFGDSNTDTGNCMAASGIIGGLPNGRFGPFLPSERASDGKLIIDYLCENATTKYLHAYLNAFEADFSNGVNFAYAGAATLWPDFSNLANQIEQFTRFQNRSIELLSKGSKQKLVQADGFKNALYLFDIGQNDMTKSSLFVNSRTISHDRMVKNVPNVALEIKKAIQGLYQLGARKFWVHNTGPLGCLPGIRDFVQYDKATDLDQNGCISYLNEPCQLLNKNISALCDELRKEMKDATIVYVDIYSIKYDLIANATSYGFVDPLISCLQDNEKHEIISICDGPKTINWDGWHYTHAANTFVASRVLSTKYSTPSLPFSSFFL